MTDQELLVDCFQRLNQADLAYLVTGSMASNFWGIPRSTHDLDFAIQLPLVALSRMVAAFAGDFHLDEQAVRAAYRPPYQFNAIHRLSAFKVGFWLPANTPFEREMFQRRIQRTLFGTPAWIATPEDLILHKLYWNRLTPSERQLGDVAGIFAVQHETIDRDYLRHWAASLDVNNSLGLLLEGKLKPKST